MRSACGSMTSATTSPGLAGSPPTTSACPTRRWIHRIGTELSPISAPCWARSASPFPIHRSLPPTPWPNASVRGSPSALAVRAATRRSAGFNGRVARVEQPPRLLHAAAHQQLCVDHDLLPVRRHFEPQWEYRWHCEPTEADRLVALATEASTRLVLADDYLVKADISSMAHGLELRVPMLDEKLFAYALTLPAALKATSTHFKIVPRALAARMLPEPVARKPKWGFSIPPYGWLADGVRQEIAATFSASTSRLTEFFAPKIYKPWVDAFRDGHTLQGVHELDLFDRVTMLLALDLHLCAMRPDHPVGGTALPM